MSSMKKSWVITLAAAGIGLFPPIAGSQPAAGKVLVGPLSRQQVRSVVNEWRDASVGDDRWKKVLGSLRRVEPGARVDVFFGTWCDDSRQEIPRLMNILDGLEGREPFRVEFVAVDRAKRQPAEAVAAHKIRFLPTIVVYRGGREVGRIVEHPARTLETDLLRLLDGSAQGLLSASETVILQYLQDEGDTLPRPAAGRSPRGFGL